MNQGNFATLVFTPSGEVRPRNRSFNARLAELISEKKYYPRSRAVACMKFRLLFSLLMSAILSQGHRTLWHTSAPTFPKLTKRPRWWRVTLRLVGRGMSGEGVVVGEDKVLSINVMLSNISDMTRCQSLPNRAGANDLQFLESSMIMCRENK